MAQKPSILKGTRDFSSTEITKRDYIFSMIKDTFKIYGFQPIETPSFEKLETLLGKYGNEGDRLIFKILNSGNYLANTRQDVLENRDLKKITSKISEKALRYDLTVPFARYVVQHQNELTLPFKRYQIQPVWRADRPQKGRFREFYQCDADVVGSTSLILEVEFVQLYDDVFTKLGLTEVEIKINNRKILAGIAEIIGAKDKLIDFTVALDKLDKIGADGVAKEMLSKGISKDAIQKIQPLFNFSGSNKEKIIQLKEMLKTSEEGLKGVLDIEFIINTIEKLGLQSAILNIDVTLARGLNYYTGAIYEVITNKVNIGSIGGGGRYDDLTSIFGLKNLSGIGISFGLDRIYIVLEELGLFKKLEIPKPKVLFLNYNEENIPNRLKALATLRANAIAAEIYPDTATSNKQKQKQFKYFQKRKIEFVILDDEIGDELSLKNITTGKIIKGNIDKLISEIKEQ